MQPVRRMGRSRECWPFFWPRKCSRERRSRRSLSGSATRSNPWADSTKPVMRFSEGCCGFSKGTLFGVGLNGRQKELTIWGSTYPYGQNVFTQPCSSSCSQLVFLRLRPSPSMLGCLLTQVQPCKGTNRPFGKIKQDVF